MSCHSKANECNDVIRLSIYEFLLMSYGNHMSISHHLEVTTGQLTLDRLKPTMPRMTPKTTLKCKRSKVHNMFNEEHVIISFRTL